MKFQSFEADTPQKALSVFFHRFSQALANLGTKNRISLLFANRAQ